MRIPFLDIVPVVCMAWMGRPAIAYLFAFIVSVARIYFVYRWPGPDILSIEIINAAIEFGVLSLFSFIFLKARKMLKVIAVQRGDIQRFHDFTAAVGTIVQGRAVAPGVAEGTAMIFMPVSPGDPDEARILRSEVEREHQRVDHAISAAIHAAQKGTVRILFPMVKGSSWFRLERRMVEEIL